MPAAVFKIMATAVILKTTTTFEIIPMPNQMMISGTTVMMGIE